MGIKYIKIAAICLAFLIAACGDQRLGKNLVIVLPDEDGTVGAVAVSDGTNEILLNTANSAAKIGNDGKVAAVSVTKDDIDTIFGTTLNAAPIPPHRFRLYFIEGSDKLTSESLAQIKDVMADIDMRGAAFDVEVTGHTDTVGKEDANSKLSLKRAHKIRDLLIQNGVDAGMIVVYGRGEWDLYVATKDNVNEPKNRRVEIIIR